MDDSFFEFLFLVFAIVENMYGGGGGVSFGPKFFPNA